ncbi:MAG TPA: HAMP domain-containing sensor histidine kinase [Polyangiaceae bacterium]|nr:HAMP domain-containing sensor histidine kinase [Polyangiaceae bacterium]
MTNRGASLRSKITWLTALIVVVSMCIAGALVATTTFLHATTVAAASSTEGVRLAEEAELDLLLHERATDPLVKRDIETDLRRRLADSRKVVTTPEEARALEDAEARVAEFLATARLGGPELATRQEAAYGALEALVTLNMEQAKEAARRAASLDQLANFVALGAGLLLLVGAGAILVWLRRSAFAPVFAIVEQMGHFTRGERGVRVREEGAAEFRALARGFNDMASTIERQREQQLTFLAGVAHDLRTPLSALKMSSATISPNRPLPSEDRVRQAFARVQRQVDRLERMVFDFLDAARIESGNLELQLEECDARDVVRASMELFEPTAPSHEFVIEVPDQPLRLTCDPARIEQVLNNLVSNAIKYSPRGGRILASLRREDGSVSLSVADEGLGIMPEDIDHVFDPFRRAGRSSEAIAGVGLGLFVARRIVEAHGGRIAVTSRPGKGSKFTVELPVSGRVEEEATAPAASCEEPAPAPG